MSENNSAIPASSRKQAIRVTLVGSVLDLTLAVLKILAGLASNSLALISDGIHSLSDLVTDALVVGLAYISHQKPDAEHPYGHRRFETIGTVVISIGLFIVAGVICFDSLIRIGKPSEFSNPGWIALLVTLVSIGSKEWIYRYTKKVGDAIGSSMLVANAWHSRTDALSSIAVLVGIIGVWMGFAWMDLAAAIVVALMIARIAWTLMSKSLAELVDTALPKEQVDAIRQHILGTPGIKGVHDLRSRLHAEKAIMDIHVQVSSRLSVSEGHFLGERLTRSLKQGFPVLTDLVVHIDPEADHNSSDPALPERAAVEFALMECWKSLLDKSQVKGFTLHYLNNQIEAEVKIDNYILNKELSNKLKETSRHLPWLKKLTLHGVF